MTDSNPQTSLRAALIGCGAVAREIHSPILRELPNVDYVGVADVDPETAHAFAREFEVPVHASDLESLIRDARPELLHILTPPETHADLATAALAAGVDVIIEKPFAPSVEDADRILEAATRSNRRAAAIHNYLAHPAVADLLRRVKSGEIGDLCAVQFMHGRRDQRYVPAAWYFDAYGGRLGETLPHAVYLLLALLPDLDVEFVSGRHLGHVRLPKGIQAKENHVDELNVELADSSGRSASIHYSLNCNLPQSLIASGTRGTLRASITAKGRVEKWHAGAPSKSETLQTLQSFLQHQSRRIPGVGKSKPSSPLSTPHGRQVAQLITSMENRTEIGGPAIRDVVRLTEAIIDAYESPRADA